MTNDMFNDAVANLQPGPNNGLYALLAFAVVALLATGFVALMIRFSK